ncbi:DMT family transporter [Stappia sp. P2PMeth1]|uniref:DMT family transporter n=1 Tax=Stappia sp. P2PMeth1 TaxID=2003586 RepID=UPI0016464DA7|nr:DMT family transporter [Stappia sp. P2PMeth1]
MPSDAGRLRDHPTSGQSNSGQPAHDHGPPPAPGDRRPLIEGLLATGAGTINNACVKLLAVMPTSQLILLRAVGTIFLLLPLMIRRGLRWPPRVVLARAALEAIATAGLMHALTLAPLSFVATVMMTIPIGVMAMNWLLAGEPLSPRGRILLLLAFSGALIATGPALAGSMEGALSAIFSAGFYVARDLLTSRRASSVPSLELSFTASVATLMLAFAMGVVGDWRPLVAGETGIIAAMIVFYILSNLLIASATRARHSTMVAATRYSAVIWAALFDLVLFDLAPRPLTLVGAALIAACGIGLVFTERKRRGP